MRREGQNLEEIFRGLTTGPEPAPKGGRWADDAPKRKAKDKAEDDEAKSKADES